MPGGFAKPTPISPPGRGLPKNGIMHLEILIVRTPCSHWQYQQRNLGDLGLGFSKAGIKDPGPKLAAMVQHHQQVCLMGMHKAVQSLVRILIGFRNVEIKGDIVPGKVLTDIHTGAFLRTMVK